VRELGGEAVVVDEDGGDGGSPELGDKFHEGITGSDRGAATQPYRASNNLSRPGTDGRVRLGT